MCQFHLYSKFAEFGMRLEFNSFDLEGNAGCVNDNFTIYNNSISSSNILDTKCGRVTGDAFFTARRVIAVFKSNSRLNAKGFNIKVERKYFLLLQRFISIISYIFSLSCGPKS